MSIQNNIIQPQSIVLNQVPLSHAIMTNVTATNGIPIATALAHPPSNVDQINEMKTGIVVEGIPIVGLPNIPVQTARNIQHSNNLVENVSQILTKPRLNDLVRDMDPTLILEEDIEEALLTYTDDFINRTLDGATAIAKHRNVHTIEVKDVHQFLTRNYGIWAPGFGTDELRPYKRSLTAESHKQRLALIQNRNSENRHLAGLISMVPSKRRRSRKSEEIANLRSNAFRYKIRIQNEENDGFHELSVCQQAFISLHGITNRRLITIKSGLRREGSSIDDMRGRHQNRPHKLSPEMVKLVEEHIRSFKGRVSHYSLKKSRKLYLPETLLRFLKKCPFFTRPLREVRISREHSRTIETRENYNGARQSFIIAGANLTWKGSPKLLYKQAIGLPKKKYLQLQQLKKFVAEEHQNYNLE
ncbi:hypothetical protein FQR65_LT13288 [Abscondita terminalis]|nr:hypothetical protein FQR65_LT13288 [Abscondita terminalis]